MEKPKTSMPIIAGILIMLSAGFKLLIFLAIMAASFFVIVPVSYTYLHPAAFLPIILVPLVAIITMAIIGGIYCLQRKKWGLALTGSIITILPFSLLGLVAVILVAISRDEFE